MSERLERVPHIERASGFARWKLHPWAASCRSFREASLGTERTTWAQAAESFGTTVHAQARYARLVRRDSGDVDGAIAADGRRCGDASEGCLDAASLAAAARQRSTGAHDFADAAWSGRAPRVDEVMWAQSPCILWPDDLVWVLATEIDFDSTFVTGAKALVRELVGTPGLEVLPIRTDADLTWDGDALNRPE